MYILMKYISLKQYGIEKEWENNFLWIVNAMKYSMMPTPDSRQEIFLTCHGKTYKSILISYTSHVYFIKKKKDI